MERRARARDERGERSGTIAVTCVVLAWVTVFALVLRHPLYASHDSVISYAHVWYLAGHLRHGIPLRMSVLEHGQAVALPYGLVPWVTAAVLRPLFGDRVVTVWLVLGAVGLMAATLWAFPELRRRWLAAAALLNPAIGFGLLIGQLPFLWASALLVVAVGLWRREKRVLAVVSAGLAQATHPAILLPLTAVLVVGACIWRNDRRILLLHYSVSVVLAAPAVWLLLVAPVLTDTSTSTKLLAFAGTMAPRALVLAVPLALVWVSRRPDAWRARASLGVVVAVNAALWVPLQLPYAWGALWRTPDTRMETFTRSAAFVPGSTYRVLRVADAKVGMYQLIRHGGRLDSEFFPESIDHRSWPTTTAYELFLDKRRVDFVMLWGGYDRTYRTNEHALLAQMAATATCGAGTARTTVVELTRDYDLYAVHRCR